MIGLSFILININVTVEIASKEFTNSATVAKMFKGPAFPVVNLVVWRLHGVRIWIAVTVEKQAMWRGHAEIKRTKKKAQRLKIKRAARNTRIQTFKKLGETFSRFRSPSELVSDSGPQLVSQEMSAFLQANGGQHMTSAP